MCAWALGHLFEKKRNVIIEKLCYQELARCYSTQEKHFDLACVRRMIEPYFYLLLVLQHTALVRPRSDQEMICHWAHRWDYLCPMICLFSGLVCSW